MIRAASILGLALGTLALGGVAIGRSPAPVNDVAVLEGMPRALSDFGFFADMREQSGTYGVESYELNTALFSDGADKLRFIYVPGGEKLRPDGEGLLQFPVGSAIIKTFAFGEDEDRRLIETRVLLHRAEGWVALPYRWNEEQTDATLALAGGRLPITTPAGEDISYRIPNKNQCKTCHSKDGAVTPIGPKARNLSRDWLDLSVKAGLLDSVPEGSDALPLWSKRKEEEPERLARAYLDVNCAHCHQPGGSASNSGLDLRWEQDDPHAIGIRKPPVAAGRGSGGLAVSVEPGDPDASIIVYRMNSTEPGVAMPELGRSSSDAEGVEVIRRWIEEMPAS